MALLDGIGGGSSFLRSQLQEDREGSSKQAQPDSDFSDIVQKTGVGISASQETSPPLRGRLAAINSSKSSPSSLPPIAYADFQKALRASPLDYDFLAQGCASNVEWIKYLVKFGLSESDRMEVAKLTLHHIFSQIKGNAYIKDNAYVDPIRYFANHFKNFEIRDEHGQVEIVKHCARLNGAATAMYVNSFGCGSLLTDKKILNFSVLNNKIS